MTGKRSSRTTGTPSAAMQAWLSSGLNGVDMFGEGAPPAGDPPVDGTSASGGAPPGHCASGASDGAASTPVELQLISNKVVQCSATVDAQLVRVRGPVKDTFVPRASEVTVVIKDLCAQILDVQPNAISGANLLEVKLGTGKGIAASGVSLTLPGKFREVITGRKFRASMEAFVHLIDDDKRRSKECAALLAESGASESISAAALKLRDSIGSADLRDGLVLASPAWADQIPLPRVIAAPEMQEKKAVPHKVKGAFRGFYIDERVAYFVEESSRRAKLVVQFDEQKFFEVIRLLSQAKFICCGIDYLEHRVGDKTERLELTGVDNVQGDLYQGGEQINEAVEELLAELKAPSTCPDTHAMPAK